MPLAIPVVVNGDATVRVVGGRKVGHAACRNPQCSADWKTGHSFWVRPVPAQVEGSKCYDCTLYTEDDAPFILLLLPQLWQEDSNRMNYQVILSTTLFICARTFGKLYFYSNMFEPHNVIQGYCMINFMLIHAAPRCVKTLILNPVNNL